MRALIITSLSGDYSGIAKEVEKQLQNQDKKQESDEVVSIHQFDMLSRSYDAKYHRDVAKTKIMIDTLLIISERLKAAI